ncbi:T9SS type A sorting domain-containing protein [Lentimicrobium sp. L6]|uniref:T9SS type A sorting domain-containing protein n=1 Tax=Lentimicrobium sp. L6 TaxID=2735916 RepID=UPI001556A892|nr:T9SS type A sorting domain-containing protein [Lentimicrobium sp. L6]NPD85025.1 T9SS type A sorting domain-containing protein [Lentimicrobium sp. L6]
MKRVLLLGVLFTTFVLFAGGKVLAQPSGYYWTTNFTSGPNSGEFIINSPVNGIESRTVEAESIDNTFHIDWDFLYNEWFNEDITLDVPFVLTFHGGDGLTKTSTINTAPVIGKFYTCNIEGLDYSDRNAIIMETDNTPQSFHATASTAVSTPSTVWPSQDVVITITLAGNKSAQEKVFVRYSDDDFSTSKVVEASGAGSTWNAATATIPGADNVGGTTIKYYAYSTTVSAVDASNHDLISLNVGNSGGSNYSYTVESSYTTKAGATTWSSTSSWDAGVVPVSGEAVTIQDNITLEGDVTVSNMTVESGKTFSVASGGSIKTNGSLTNNGIVELLSISSKSSRLAPPTGSLIVDGGISGSGYFSASLDVVGHNDVSDEGWHLLSSPIDGYVISGSVFEPGSGNDDLYKWDEASGTWFNYHGTGFATFDEGIGYLCAYKTSATKTFSGTIVNSDIESIDLAYSAGGIDDNWHLLGNPFTSALDWGAGTWGISNISVPQVYDEASKAYVAVNALGDIIPAMQGFFVQTTNATNSITIPKDARVHDFTNWYKDTDENSNTIKLQLVGSEMESKDLFMVGFDENSSEAYDIEFDSHKLFSLANVPQFFMQNESGEQFSVNYLANDGNEKKIPLHIKVPAAGTYTISVAENELAANSKVYLEDKFSNQQIELIGEQSYTFVASEEDNEDRFLLYFNKATGINELAKDNLQAYISGQNLYILGESGPAQLEVFDIQGKQLVSEQIVLDENYKKALSLPSGIYVVRVQNSEFVKSNKVIIK